MNSSIKKDLSDIFRAVSNVFGRSKFLALFCAIFILIYFILPKNVVIQTWVEAKNRFLLQVEHNISALRSKIFVQESLELQISELQKEILLLKRQLQEQNIMVNQYYNLQKLLQFTPQDSPFHTSKVLKVMQEQFANSMYISGGIGNNSAGNPVLDSSGVIGVISNVYEDYSAVTLYTDPSFKISCYGMQSGNRYILTGTGKSNVMRLEYIDNDVLEIIEEDLVTSGLGGMFVAGTMIGKLRSVGDGYLVYKQTEFLANPYVIVME